MNDTESGAEALARIKPRRRELATNICLRPDLLDLWDELTTELEETDSGENPNQRLAAAAPTAAVRKLAQRVQAVEQEIEDSQIRFLFRAIPKDEWQALTEQHPRRDGNQMDAFVGYNRDAVVDAAIRKSLVSPAFNDCTIDDCPHVDCGSWQQLEKVCNPSEWAELRKTVDEVNSAVKAVPKSPLASAILGRSGSASRRPKRGA